MKSSPINETQLELQLIVKSIASQHLQFNFSQNFGWEQFCLTAPYRPNPQIERPPKAKRALDTNAGCRLAPSNLEKKEMVRPVLLFGHAIYKIITFSRLGSGVGSSSRFLTQTYFMWITRTWLPGPELHTPQTFVPVRAIRRRTRVVFFHISSSTSKKNNTENRTPMLDHIRKLHFSEGKPFSHRHRPTDREQTLALFSKNRHQLAGTNRNFNLNLFI